MTVYLVGHGPGDPGLITVAGRALLERADAVVYDRLANAELLKLVPENAVQVTAGRGTGSIDLTQDQITEKVLRVHVAGGVAMRHHRQQVALRRLADALVPEPREIAGAFYQFGLTLVFSGDHAARAGQGCGNIGPARQLAAVLPRKVEQHG